MKREWSDTGRPRHPHVERALELGVGTQAAPGLSNGIGEWQRRLVAEARELGGDDVPKVANAFGSLVKDFKS